VKGKEGRDGKGRGKEEKKEGRDRACLLFL